MDNLDDLLSELDAEFDQPKKTEETKLHYSEIENVAFRNTTTWDGEVPMTVVDTDGAVYYTGRDGFVFASLSPEPTFAKPPQGLAEAQEMNGVADHGLGKKLFKGDFKKTGPDRVEFIESLTGAFAIGSKTDLSEGAKKHLDDRFPGLTYWNGDKEVYIAQMKAQPEAINETPIVKAYEAYLNVKKGHTPYKTFRDEIYPNILAEREEAAIIPEAIAQKPMTPEESFKTDPIPDDNLEGKGWALPEVACHTEGNEPISALPTGFDIEPLPSDNPQPDLFSIHGLPPTIGEATKGRETIYNTDNVTPPEQTKVFIGIDPGAAGGIAATCSEGVVGTWEMPVLEDGGIDVNMLSNIIRSLVSQYNCTVIIEEVHSIFGSSASSNFQFGWNCGQIDTVIKMLNVKWHRIQPKAWQKEIWTLADMVYQPLKPEQKKPSVDTKPTSSMAAHRLFPGVDMRGTIIEKYYGDNANNRKLKRVGQLIPSKKVEDHDGIVDSLLISEYGRRKNL